MLLVDKVNGAVGRTTPSLTGAIKASAVSQSSSIAIFSRDWKTRLHVWMCREWEDVLKEEKEKHIKMNVNKI